MNGPEPTWLSIALNGSVSAMRLGIMNGTFDDGLPSESITRPYGSLSAMVKVLSFTAFISATNSIIFWPIASRAAQRLIEATQSSPVTGLPSCHSSPSRRVKVVDHVAVVARDVGRREDRIEDGEVAGLHEAQRFLVLC
jgi:hypothetical protein